MAFPQCSGTRWRESLASPTNRPYIEQMANELPKEEAERRAREVAQRMLTTPKLIKKAAKPIAPKTNVTKGKRR